MADSDPTTHMLMCLARGSITSGVAAARCCS